MVSRNVVDVVVFAEISREIPSASVGYSEDGCGVFRRNFANHIQDCVLSMKLVTLNLIHQLMHFYIQ